MFQHLLVSLQLNLYKYLIKEWKKPLEKVFVAYKEKIKTLILHKS